MNTFLVSNDFAQCARVLDQKRLSRQITECIQLCRVLYCYNTLKKEMNGRVPHTIMWPLATRLWCLDASNVLIPVLPELKRYCDVCNECWKASHAGQSHGSVSSFDWSRYLVEDLRSNQRPLEKDITEGLDRILPLPRILSWSSGVMKSHRAALLRKDPTHYYPVFEREGLEIPPLDMKYVWEAPLVTNKTEKNL